MLIRHWELEKNIFLVILCWLWGIHKAKEIKISSLARGIKIINWAKETNALVVNLTSLLFRFLIKSHVATSLINYHSITSMRKNKNLKCKYLVKNRIGHYNFKFFAFLNYFFSFLLTFFGCSFILYILSSSTLVWACVWQKDDLTNKILLISNLLNQIFITKNGSTSNWNIRHTG